MSYIQERIHAQQARNAHYNGTRLHHAPNGEWLPDDETLQARQRNDHRQREHEEWIREKNETVRRSKEHMREIAESNKPRHNIWGEPFYQDPSEKYDHKTKEHNRKIAINKLLAEEKQAYEIKNAIEVLSQNGFSVTRNNPHTHKYEYPN
jgi:hypothetical protein